MLAAVVVSASSASIYKLILTQLANCGKSRPVGAASPISPALYDPFWKEPAMELAVASPVNHAPLAHEDRKQTAQRVAADMFSHQPDWVTFFREVLGVDGLIRKLFPNADDYA